MSRYTQRKVVEKWRDLLPVIELKENFLKVSVKGKTSKFPIQGNHLQSIRRRNIGYK